MALYYRENDNDDDVDDASGIYNSCQIRNLQKVSLGTAKTPILTLSAMGKGESSRAVLSVKHIKWKGT